MRVPTQWKSLMSSRCSLFVKVSRTARIVDNLSHNLCQHQASPEDISVVCRSVRVFVSLQSLAIGELILQCNWFGVVMMLARIRLFR